MPKVTILQRIVPHYRIPFFESLYRELSESGIELQLIYGQEFPGHVPRSSQLEHPWVSRVKNVYVNTPLGQLVWQSCGKLLQGSDLVVLEQANSLLRNQLLLIQKPWTKCQIAYWGHGKNFQAERGDWLKEFLKKKLLGRADWWFAYTDSSAEIVQGAGFPSERITVVQNTIDTRKLEYELNAVSEADAEACRASLGIHSTRVGLYCGGMYPEKRLDFLLDAAHLIRRRISDFNLVFIGNGPDQWKVEQAARRYDWIHCLGARFGREQAIWLKASSVLLLPAAVGLVIVDSFISGTPLITTRTAGHGPEIAYLKSHENGIITSPSLDEYAGAIADYLLSTEAQQSLTNGCHRSGNEYTLEKMVLTFTAGIKSCLSKGPAMVANQN